MYLLAFTEINKMQINVNKLVSFAGIKGTEQRKDSFVFFLLMVGQSFDLSYIGFS